MPLGIPAHAGAVGLLNQLQAASGGSERHTNSPIVRYIRQNRDSFGLGQRSAPAMLLMRLSLNNNMIVESRAEVNGGLGMATGGAIFPSSGPFCLPVRPASPML